MGSINKKFGLQSTAVEEWLPWGGIVRPSVMKQKDGSLFSIIEYQPYSYFADGTYPVWPFRRGWVLWQEIQYTEEQGRRYYLVICWNPFVTSSSFTLNALRPKIRKEKALDYFEQEIQRFLADFQRLTEAHLLEYQEIMDVLSFALSHGENHETMPEVPLYMDALLSENIDMKFGANSMMINGKSLYVVSLLEPWPTNEIYAGIQTMTYRHSRRLVCFSQKESKRNLKKYTSTWFPGRKAVRQLITEDLLYQYNGYYTDSFQFLLDEENRIPFQKFFEHLLDSIGVNYIVQHYGLKETFWGSIPGLFLAQSRPPIMGFRHLSEFLEATAKKQQKQENVLETARTRLVPTTVDVTKYFRVEKKDDDNVQA